MKFSECVEIVGSKPSRYQGIKQYVSTGALDSDHIDENSIEEYAYDDRPSRADLVAEAGNVLFAKMAETKKTLVINNQNEKYLFSTGFFAVKPKKNVLTTECLYYLLNSNTFLSQKDKYSSGATQKAISNASLEKIIVNIPCFLKQEDIVKQLDKLSNIIKKTRKQLLNFDLLIKSRFIEMFGDPRINSKNLPSVKFIDVIKLQRGFDLPVQERDSTGKINVYGSNGVLGKHNEIKVKGPGIVTGRSGTLGKVYYVLEDYWPLNTTLFSVDTHGNNVIYLKYLLEAFELERFTEGAGVPTLNRNIVHEKEIINAPLELQQQFASFVLQIDKSKFENTTQEIAA